MIKRTQRRPSLSLKWADPLIQPEPILLGFKERVSLDALGFFISVDFCIRTVTWLFVGVFPLQSLTPNQQPVKMLLYTSSFQVFDIYHGSLLSLPLCFFLQNDLSSAYLHSVAAQPHKHYNEERAFPFFSKVVTFLLSRKLVKDHTAAVCGSVETLLVSQVALQCFTHEFNMWVQA